MALDNTISQAACGNYNIVAEYEGWRGQNHSRCSPGVCRTRANRSSADVARFVVFWDLVAKLRSSRQAAGNRLQHRAGTVARVELQEQARDMILHRALGQPEHLADLAVAEAAGRQPDDAALAFGEGLGEFIVEPGLGASLDIAQQRFG